MQQEIHDITAQDFKDFPLHGYGKVRQRYPTARALIPPTNQSFHAVQITSPRDPSYLTSIIEPTQVLRITNIDWVRTCRLPSSTSTRWPPTSLHASHSC